MGQIYKVWAVRDDKAKAFSPPQLAKTLGTAERDFRGILGNKDTLPAKNPEDFSMFELGEYDEDKGLMIPLDTPRHIAKAIDLISVQQ